MTLTDGKKHNAHGLEDLILLKWPYNPRQTTSLIGNPYQNTNGIFYRTRTNNSKIYMETQIPRIAKTTLRKKNKVGGITLLDLTLYYKAIIIKRVCYWHKSRHTDQWNKIESPEINPCLYVQLIHDKEGKNIQWGKDSLFNKWCCKNWISMCKRIILDYFLTLCTKINSKLIKDLNVRPKTIKLPEANVSSVLFDIGFRNIFLDLSPLARETKPKSTNGLLQTEKLLHSEENHQKNEKPAYWLNERRFARDISDKRLISKMYKKHIQLNINKTNNLIKKWAEVLNRHFSKEDR